MPPPLASNLEGAEDKGLGDSQQRWKQEGTQKYFFLTPSTRAKSVIAILQSFQ